jgi:hypothetical protein
MTVVEATGGSTGSALAFICAVKGYMFTVVSSDAYAEEKLKTMAASGADVIGAENLHLRKASSLDGALHGSTSILTWSCSRRGPGIRIGDWKHAQQQAPLPLTQPTRRQQVHQQMQQPQSATTEGIK